MISPSLTVRVDGDKSLSLLPIILDMLFIKMALERRVTLQDCEPSTTISREYCLSLVDVVSSSFIFSTRRSTHACRLTWAEEEGTPCLPRPRMMCDELLLPSLALGDSVVDEPSGQDTEKENFDDESTAVDFSAVTMGCPVAL